MTTPTSVPATPAQLERLGRYRIVRPLSKGGMALVYEARRESLAGVSPRVAIKLILPEFAGSDGFQELFINEARLGAAMHHQNLVGIQDFDRDGDKFFLVMEYVEGFTLRRVVSVAHKNALAVPLGVVAEIGRQACDGLDHAHRAHDEQGRALGLVHRDVKPSNLILNPHGVVKVLDFGISKGRLVIERKGAVRGTWGFMAPEQARGDEVGPEADVFALAVVLYELAALRPMFDQRPPDEIRRLLEDDHAARMATLLDRAYAPIVPVLVRALQRDPAARYPSAAEFGRALSALLPDPITARDEVTRFYQQVDALASGKAPGVRPERAEPANASASMVEPAPAPRGPSLWTLAAFTLAVATAVLLCVGLAAFAASPLPGQIWASITARPAPVEAPALSGLAADEPAGPAGEGAPGEARGAPSRAVRLPPAESIAAAEDAPIAKRATPAAPSEPETVIVRVNRKPAPPAPSPVDAPVAAPTPEPVAEVPAGFGHLTISALPSGFTVYIDGKLVNRGPVSDREFAAGHHLVTITAADGRTKQFEVDLAVDQSLKRIWDFDRAEFRR